MHLGLHYAVYYRVGPPAFVYRGELHLDSIFLNESDAEDYIAGKPMSSVSYEIWLTKEGWDNASQMVDKSDACRQVYGAILKKYKDRVVNGTLSLYQCPDV